jgi:hypothetical protein
MLFWLAREILEEELDSMLGRPVILLEARPVEKRLLRGISSGGGSGVILSGAAMETTVEKEISKWSCDNWKWDAGALRHSTPL